MSVVDRLFIPSHRDPRSISEVHRINVKTFKKDAEEICSYTTAVVYTNCNKNKRLGFIATQDFSNSGLLYGIASVLSARMQTHFM